MEGARRLHGISGFNIDRVAAAAGDDLVVTVDARAERT
jgi:hypothetical protein